MKFNLKKIDEFRTEIMGQSKPDEPTMQIDPMIVISDLALIDEERAELGRACAAADIVEIADAIADSIVVLTQLSFHCGIDIDAVLEEVHRSNMTKVGGHFDDADKYIKPDTYEPADIKSVLFPDFDCVKSEDTIITDNDKVAYVDWLLECSEYGNCKKCIYDLDTECLPRNGLCDWAAGRDIFKRWFDNKEKNNGR